jgi:cell division protein FtsQ
MTTYAPTRPGLRRPGPRRPGPRRAPARVPPRAVPMDARIRDRRVAVIRAEGRRRLHRLLAALGVLACAALAAGAVLSPILDVDRIAVRGAPAGTEDAIRAAAGIEHGEPLLLVNTADVAARIEALRWVADARVERELPGVLAVEVTPRTPAGWAPATDGTFLVIDSRGDVVTSAVAPPAGLPRLGAETAEPSTRTFQPAAARVAGALTPELRARAVAVSVSGGEAAVALADGPQLRLGAPREVAAKARAAAAVLAATAGVPVTYIDVRVPSAPVTG